MVVQKVEHLSLEERQARGEQARDRTPVSAHGGWTPAGIFLGWTKGEGADGKGRRRRVRCLFRHKSSLQIAARNDHANPSRVRPPITS
jgi:hypothetical protein